MTESTFRIEQMDCPTEERMIRARLEPMEGIEGLDFNLMSRTLTVRHRLEGELAIVTAIASLGMNAVSLAAERRAIELPVVQPSFWRKPSTILTIVAGVLALTAEGIVLSGGDESSLYVRLLAGIAIVLGGFEVAGKAWRSLRTFTLNINFLMAVAVIGAVIIGEWTEGAVVIFLFAVAEMIEARSLDRARNAIRKLMEVAPEIASVRRNGAWRDMPVDDVGRGEIVRIRPGERLPLDGIVREGGSAVNQAPITGESMPVEKGIGDDVFAGTINGKGTFDYEVTRIASESTISQVIRLVEQATANRASVERFVDRFAGYYTPIIFAIAIAVALGGPLIFGGAWMDWIYRGLVLLVIGCPCALVISTPVTIVSGLASAARRGILIKGGTYLELGARLKGIAFDKTGTITKGRPDVTDVIALADIPADEILHIAAAVEAKSEHPIASAIVAEHELHHADEEEIPIRAFESITGMGIRAEVDGRIIHVGNHRLAHDLGFCNAEVERRLEELEADGKTTVVVVRDETVVGILGVADMLRDDSRAAVAELQRLGLQTAILTGDNVVTARAIAREVGIEEIRANLLPTDKIVAVAELKARVGAMGMVGDGINDAPALAEASVGFAMGAASTDVALETADVALMEDNLMKLPEYVRLSRRAIGVLRQNIAIALGLKLVFFVLALLGEATLWMAVFADMGASLIVVANGLRLLSRSGER